MARGLESLLTDARSAWTSRFPDIKSLMALLSMQTEINHATPQPERHRTLYCTACSSSPISRSLVFNLFIFFQPLLSLFFSFSLLYHFGYARGTLNFNPKQKLRVKFTNAVVESSRRFTQLFSQWNVRYRVPTALAFRTPDAALKKKDFKK